jgi:hypothetical protein
MSLVHTNKTLKRLSAASAIRWKGRNFELLDRAKLADLAGGDHRLDPLDGKRLRYRDLCHLGRVAAGVLAGAGDLRADGFKSGCGGHAASL